MLQQYSLFGLVPEASCYASTSSSSSSTGLLMISPGAAMSTSANSLLQPPPALPMLASREHHALQSFLIQQHQQNLAAMLTANRIATAAAATESADRKKLFVGNLPHNTKLADLIAIFDKFGRVNEQLSVVKDDNYAFVHFYDEKDAQLALAELNNSLFNGKYIRVQFSNSNGHIKQKSKSKYLSYFVRCSFKIEPI
jgi:hypothetical protein